MKGESHAVETERNEAREALPGPSARTVRASSWLLLGGILLFVVFVRARFIPIPLERDEGEFAYIGQLILGGFQPQTMVNATKFPGTSLAYALSMLLFGQSIQGVRIGLILVNCSATAVLFLLARRLMREGAALAASAAYALLSLSASVVGFAAHATQFVVLPALAGALILLRARERGSLPLLAASGALFAFALLCKQPGVFFLLFGCACLVQGRFSTDPAANRGRLPREFGAFLLGAAAPLAVVFLWIAASGGLGRFLFWSFTYVNRYVTQIPLSRFFSRLLLKFPAIPDGNLLLWVLALLGLVTLLRPGGSAGRRPFLLLFSLFSFLSVCPGLFFREHYFVLLLPAVALLAGQATDFLGSAWERRLPGRGAGFAGVGVFAVAAALGVYAQRDYLFRESPEAIGRRVFGANPFPESIEVARFIRERSAPGDRIAVVGSEPQIYFYSQRLAATRYLYTYPLTERHEFREPMQEEMIREIEATHPKFIVVVWVPMSWLRLPEEGSPVNRWLNSRLPESYRPVGVVDLLSPEPTVYRWLGDVDGYTVQSEYFILVYERMT